MGGDVTHHKKKWAPEGGIIRSARTIISKSKEEKSKK